jgi:Tfp pilus assembly protein FimT
VTLLELVVAVAVIGVLAGTGIVFLPRHGMTVAQAQRITSSAITFTRFEAIKQNASFTIALTPGATELVVTRTEDGSVRRSYALDPQDNAVEIKSVEPAGSITFNARGVATVPVTRIVRVGIVGGADTDRSFQVSGQGAVTEAP